MLALSLLYGFPVDDELKKITNILEWILAFLIAISLVVAVILGLVARLAL